MSYLMFCADLPDGRVFQDRFQAVATTVPSVERIGQMAEICRSILIRGEIEQAGLLPDAPEVGRGRSTLPARFVAERKPDELGPHGIDGGRFGVEHEIRSPSQARDRASQLLRGRDAGDTRACRVAMSVVRGFCVRSAVWRRAPSALPVAAERSSRLRGGVRRAI